MKKTLCALAIGATLVSPVAFADVSVYGRAHLSVDLLDDGKDYSEVSLSSNSSRLGFKAEKKFNDLTAFAQVEQEINFAQGSGDWASRDTFAGLKGSFGSIRAGKFDSPFKVARDPANFFGDQLGDMRNLTRADDGRFDERPQNTIHYQTPSFSGLQGNIAYSFHEGAYANNTAVSGSQTLDITKDQNGNITDVKLVTSGATADKLDKKDQAISASVTYKNGPFNAALAYEKYDENATRGERDAVRLAASYKVIPALTLGVFYQTVEHETKKTANADVYGVGADYKIGDKTYIRGHYFTRDADEADNNSDLWALGVEHRLDSAFRIYANYALVSNDSKVRLTPWSQARTTSVSGVNGEDASGLSVGMRYDF